jgi:hypothetical protein
MSHVFISYARVDHQRAEQLYQSRGIDTWIDLDDIPKSAEWNHVIDEALDDTSVMLVIVTQASNDSSQVGGEWYRALTLNKPVLPLLFEAVQMPRTLAQFNGIDFTQDFKTALAQSGLALITRSSSRLEELQQINSALRQYEGGNDKEHVQHALVANSRQVSDLTRRMSEQEERVRRGLEEERRKWIARLASPTHPKRPRVAGPHLQDVTNYFRDRTSKIGELGEALENPATRLIKIIGPAGIGKTALVSMVLAGLESNTWPHRQDGPQVDSIPFCTQ